MTVIRPVSALSGRSAKRRAGPPAALAWLVLALPGLLVGPGTAAAQQGFKPLAPGVLKVIRPDASADDLVLRGDLLEVTVGQKDKAWTPKRAAANTTFVERSKDRVIQPDVWCLEFAFKSPRLLEVDVPVADLKMRRKPIWYLLYRVRNSGGRRAVVGEDGKPKQPFETFETPVRFVPHFVLESLEPVVDADGIIRYRAYLDRLVPTALAAIRREEKFPANEQLFDSASMVTSDIGPGESRWGVAIWEDVDPRIDFFSIYVRGLTNAMQWRRRPGDAEIRATDPPAAHMDQALESLRLDFWRPRVGGRGEGTEMSVGYAGMFERIAIGSRLIEAAGRTAGANAQPLAAIEGLGLTWSDLLDPAGADAVGSLLPLETVLTKLAMLPKGADRSRLFRDLCGDLGLKGFTDLVAGASGDVPADREAQRREALAAMKLTPEDVRQRPLASLATIVRSLESAPTYQARLAREWAIFGADGRWIERFVQDIAAARALAAMRECGLDPGLVAAADARAAFEMAQVALDAEKDAEKRRQLQEALLGPRGPLVYAAAGAVHEGIDHTWVFRYESSPGGL
jgi:hypothetical protein